MADDVASLRWARVARDKEHSPPAEGRVRMDHGWGLVGCRIAMSGAMGQKTCECGSAARRKRKVAVVVHGQTACSNTAEVETDSKPSD